MKLLLPAAALGSLFLVLGCKPSGDNPSVAANPGAKNVVLLRYKTGSESTEQRERGFLETLEREYPQINVLSSNEYAGTSPESSLDKAQNVLNKHGGKVHGMFGVCEPNANGMLKALENTGLAKQVKLIAFDPSPELVQGLREDKVHGIVLQDPFTMGHKAVTTMVQHLQGQQVPQRISTGEFVATPENMQGQDEQGNDIHRLLHPVQYTDDQQARPAQTKYVIAVIPKGTTHEFWKSVHAGAEQAARELGNVEVRWKGPLTEDNDAAQINVVQDFTVQKVSGICLAPNDSRSLVHAVRDAGAAGIPVVIFDSGLEDPEAYVSYVATDNYHGGVLAARRMAEALGVEPGPAKEPASEE